MLGKKKKNHAGIWIYHERINPKKVIQIIYLKKKNYVELELFGISKEKGNTKRKERV